MRRLLCALLGHRHDAGVTPETSLTYFCNRCCRLIEGGLSIYR